MPLIRESTVPLVYDASRLVYRDSVIAETRRGQDKRNLFLRVTDVSF
jgi:hypothetical protein